MGKYSLDAFEQYPLTKLRPVMTGGLSGSYRLLELSWLALEPELGARLSPPENGDGIVLLRLRLDADRDVAEACGFIRRIGVCYAGGKNLAGVVMETGPYSGSALTGLVQAYAQGFESSYLLAEPGTELMAVCCKQQVRTGLWLDLNRGILNLRRAIAEANLQKTWREAPVYLYANRSMTEEELDAAIRWHASGVNQAAPVGPQMTLRRMMFPKDLTAGGALPLRMWWQNLGTAPVYREVFVRLELGRGEERLAVSIPETMRPGLGDTTLNVTAQLPRVSCGSYDIWVGLETDRGYLPLAMDAPAEKGMYRIGELNLDDAVRPHLTTMWETQYADGYYPLEDPAQPE